MKSAQIAMLTLSALVGFSFAGEPATKPASVYPLNTCIMSGETLPTDGTVQIEQIGGREVRFCCKDCVGSFKKDVEANQKKLDAKIVETLKATYPVKNCVVSDEALGGMGEPILYVHRATNQLVEFCCKDCVKQFEKNPGKYLAKIDEAAATQPSK